MSGLISGSLQRPGAKNRLDQAMFFDGPWPSDSDEPLKALNRAGEKNLHAHAAVLNRRIAVLDASGKQEGWGHGLLRFRMIYSLRRVNVDGHGEQQKFLDVFSYSPEGSWWIRFEIGSACAPVSIARAHRNPIPSDVPARPLFWFDYRLRFIKALIRYGLPDPCTNHGSNRNRLIGSHSSEPPRTVHSLPYTGERC